jgi:hypothetical protein
MAGRASHARPFLVCRTVAQDRAYWIGVPPEGDALSLPPEPIELEACQIVPVVFVKK